MGDPKDNVDTGPMVSLEAREEVHQQVLRSIDDGANLIIGAEIPKIPGAFYPITLLSNVKPGLWLLMRKFWPRICRNKAKMKIMLSI